MKTTLFKIVTAVCLVVPLAGLAQNGTLLTTFTNPAPAAGDLFGSSVAAMGNDRILIGTSHPFGGVACLFSTSGTLLTTFTNPMPQVADYFGTDVAAVVNDLVLIGAYNDSAPGAAFLLSTNGTFLRTFTSPKPAWGDLFGSTLMAVGNDRVLIGAYADSTSGLEAGAAYLFSTNGTLLTTFTNPTPAVYDSFSWSMAPMGNDRVLIGAISDSTGATNAGAVYLFTTNGTLLTTFTSPNPGAGDFFGYSVAAMGNDRVLIGALSDDRSATDAGAAYLFTTNGTWLMTFINPTPDAMDAFGYSVAAVGNDRVLIGAISDNTGATNAGAAYLFLIQPKVTIGRIITNTVAISWPSGWNGFTLQQNTNGIATVNWSNVTATVQDDGTNRSVTVPAFLMANRFYRLQK